MRNVRCHSDVKACRQAPAAVIIALILLLAASPPWAAADEKPALLPAGARSRLFDRLKEIQATLTTFQAKFTELRSVTGLAMPIRYEGRLYFEKGRLFFMQYDHPARHILRVQGKEALMYIEGSPTADVMRLSDQGAVAENAAFLAWNPDRFTGTVSETADAFLFEDKNNLATLTFALNKQTLIMNHLKIDNRNGDITDIRFSSETLNAPLPENIRNYHLPEGVVLNPMTQP